MATNPSVSMASGSASPPSKGYIGAASAEPVFVVDNEEASGSSRPPPLTQEGEATAKKNGLKVVKADEEEGKRADLPLVRSAIPNEVKEFVVESFACFLSYSTVQDEVFKRFGFRIDGRSLQNYDPQHRHCRLGKRLRRLYDEVRKSYISNTHHVAISHQAQRLRLISRVVEKATTSKDYNAALKGLELAAKEMGGVLEGKSVVEHRGGVVHVHSSIEDARREVAMRLAQVVDGGMLTALPSPTDNPQSSANPDAQE